jgi:8-oxo-dGTP diphosphatase
VTRLIVSAAVIEHNERFLVARRPAGVHLEGLWEFPGGKCEQGESIEACLERELKEELGVDARIGAPLLLTRHAYADREVELHFLRCELVGDPQPRLGQELAWVERRQLAMLPFPPADRELIDLLIRG